MTRWLLVASNQVISGEDRPQGEEALRSGDFQDVNCNRGGVSFENEALEEVGEVQASKESVELSGDEMPDEHADGNCGR